MKKSKFSPQQIAKILKEFDNGKTAAEISRDHGISTAAFYKWRERYGGMNGKELKRLKQLEEENSRLKQMYASLSLDYDMAKEIIEKKL
jgi:putative transposase